MAQLRHDYQKFVDRGAEIIIIGPETEDAFNQYWQKFNFQFIGLPDPKHVVLKLFGQKVNLFKLGRMPAQMIIDKTGYVRFIHYGHDMTDIPKNEDVFRILDQLNT
ncbi:MAG: redoxin domain-containing protein [Anaerolineaceae bacterium]|nr:redoxin domain-containing protein [Anaerolineaceae bacterium]